MRLLCIIHAYLLNNGQIRMAVRFLCHLINDASHLVSPATEGGKDRASLGFPPAELGKNLCADGRKTVSLQPKSNDTTLCVSLSEGNSYWKQFNKEREKRMKKMILMAIVGLMAALPLQAQHYQDSRYYNPRTGRLDYRGGSRPTTYRSRPGYLDAYYGFRVGPTFTTVNSDDPYLDGSSMKTGLNVGMAAGFGISYRTPLYLETGLYYTQKGGKGKADGTRFTYNLDYLEVPLVFKYKHFVDNAFSIEPFIGGYVACGVAGNIKDFGQREAYKSFSDSPYTFQRFDGGLRLGCGLRYDMLYADVTYDLGLANVSHNAFDDARNSALMLNFGIEF